MSRLVIIGTGLAGYTLAREFRKRDQDTELTIITRDDGSSYSKPMLSNALEKGKSADTLVMANAEKMATDLNARILTRTDVANIDTTENNVTTDKQTIPYDQLVLANGAYTISAPIGGNASEQIISVNNLDDYRIFRSQLEIGKRVVIIGAGLIGCEFANDLSSIGAEISIVDLAEQALGRLLPTTAADTLKEKLSALGVTWQLDNAVTEVNKGDDGLVVSLKDGTTLNADIVLSAIGLRADLTLAETAGIDTGRGIMVDRFLRSSNEHIYALGDCAQVEDLHLPFVMPLMNAARALAATLSGEQTAVNYPAMPVVVKTPCYPIIVCPPPRPVEGAWDEEQTDGGVRATYKDADNKVLGFVLTGDLTRERMAMSKLVDDWLV